LSGADVEVAKPAPKTVYDLHFEVLVRGLIEGED
jgi:hypothetical protein